MKHLDSSGFRFLTVSLASILLLYGCASAPAPAVSSYEVPSAIDLKRVMDIVEQSTAYVLGGPVTVTERPMPAILPWTASPAVVDWKHRVLEGLGAVVIPHINCPGSVASMEKLIAGVSGLRFVAACISPTQTSTLIQFVEIARAEDRISTPLIATSEVSVIASASRLILDRLSNGRAGVTPAVATTAAEFRAASGFVAETHKTATKMDANERGVRLGSTAVPLVCFAPRTGPLPVRIDPDSEMAVATLHEQLIVDIESPVDTGYVHVETDGGVEGWVRRSDLRWTPCPIG